MSQVAWNGNESQDLDRIFLPVGLDGVFCVRVHELSHAAEIDEGPATKDSDVLFFGFSVDMLNDRLTDDEDEKREEEPELAIQERPARNFGPHEVRHQDDDWVANKLRVSGGGDPGECLSRLHGAVFLNSVL